MSKRDNIFSQAPSGRPETGQGGFSEPIQAQSSSATGNHEETRTRLERDREQALSQGNFGVAQSITNRLDDNTREVALAEENRWDIFEDEDDNVDVSTSRREARVSRPSTRSIEERSRSPPRTTNRYRGKAARGVAARPNARTVKSSSRDEPSTSGPDSFRAAAQANVSGAFNRPEAPTSVQVTEPTDPTTTPQAFAMPVVSATAQTAAPTGGGRAPLQQHLHAIADSGPANATTAAAQERQIGGTREDLDFHLIRHTVVYAEVQIELRKLREENTKLKESAAKKDAEHEKQIGDLNALHLKHSAEDAKQSAHNAKKIGDLNARMTTLQDAHDDLQTENIRLIDQLNNLQETQGTRLQEPEDRHKEQAQRKKLESVSANRKNDWLSKSPRRSQKTTSCLLKRYKRERTSSCRIPGVKKVNSQHRDRKHPQSRGLGLLLANETAQRRQGQHRRVGSLLVQKH